MRAFIYNPPRSSLDIIYEDDQIIVVNKPGELLSVPGKSADHKDSLETRLREIYPETLLVHRLDLATSGIMVFARSAHAQRHLGLQFEKRIPKKIYMARVRGHLRAETGRINLPLITDWPNRPKQHVNFERGKSSQTDWELIDLEGPHSRVMLYPKTGRSHQLRVHMMAIGHPILGDRFYADQEAFRAAKRLQLHAETLHIRHPADGRWMTFTTPCPF